MSKVLGLYATSKYVKYAALSVVNGKTSVLSSGIKFVKNSLAEDLKMIINDNCDNETKIITNSEIAKLINVKIFKNIADKDIPHVIHLEFTDWCENNGKDEKLYHKKYNVSEAVIGEYRKGSLAIVSNEYIKEIKKVDTRIEAIYPYDLLLENIRLTEEKNYAVINIDSISTISIVLNSKVIETENLNVNASEIFDRYSEICGSYEKSYNECRELNMYNESIVSTDLEKIVESVIQKIMVTSKEIINNNGGLVKKIYLTGIGSIFINIDTLFTEYFEIRTELLKPKYIDDSTDQMDAIQFIQPIVLATSYLLGNNQTLNSMKKTNNFFEKLTASNKIIKKKDIKIEERKPFITVNEDILNRVVKYSIYSNIVLFLVIISYLTYSFVYNGTISDINKEVSANSNKYVEQTQDIRDDISYINNLTSLYKKENQEVNSLINLNNSDKYTVYNVASFMQKLTNIIPSDLTLKKISSDDNKNVVIIAEANNYPSLGYFIADLRLRTDILKNIVVKNINSASANVTVEIGGELP